MKIKSENRQWDLNIKRASNYCIEIKELHGSEGEFEGSSIHIPAESVPQLIEYLKKYQKKRSEK